ncbi:MAG: glycogen-binding domain-containing protein [Candidatus Eisenbacteria bacterium]
MRTGIALYVTILLIAAGCLYGGMRKVPEGIELTYDDPAAFSVSVAGSFNNWDTGSNPMAKDDEGVWSAVIPLPPGKHEYKFVVNGSDWMADPDNPKIVGDYGNSGIEIDSDGDIVLAGAVDVVSNTAANARVKINGWFRGTYTTRRDGLGDVRWRLSRPAHEMYLGFNPTIGPDVKGSVTMRIDSGEGDIREVTADLYAGRLAFKSDLFDATAYHNEEIVSFDDPLEIVGHIDLPGTVWEEDIDFGRGTQGVITDLRLKGIGVRALYSNTYDDDIYNSDARWYTDPADQQIKSMTRYDNTGTDVLAVRARRSFLGAEWGATLVSQRDGWWIGFEEGNEVDPAIEAYRAETGDNGSTWFEAGTSDMLIGGDVAVEPAVWLSLFGEFATTTYKAMWDAGNRVRIQGDQKVDGRIDAPIGDEDGSRFKTGFDASAGDCALRFTFEQARFDGMSEDEAYVSHLALPFEDPDNRLIDLYGIAIVKDSTHYRAYMKANGIDEFIVYEHDPLPKRDVDIVEVDAATKFMGMDLGVEVDIVKSTWDYIDPDMENAENTQVLVLPSVGGRLLGERLSYDLLYGISRDNLSGRMPSAFDRGEFSARGDFAITERWGIYYNVRWVNYDWTEDDTGMSESFFNPHLALVWSPIASVEMRLGYGLSPLYYVDTPVEGREIGRERWLSSYLWPRPGATLIDAEMALDDLKIITLMGVISF